VKVDFLGLGLLAASVSFFVSNLVKSYPDVIRMDPGYVRVVSQIAALCSGFCVVAWGVGRYSKGIAGIVLIISAYSSLIMITIFAVEHTPEGIGRSNEYSSEYWSRVYVLVYAFGFFVSHASALWIPVTAFSRSLLLRYKLAFAGIIIYAFSSIMYAVLLAIAPVVVHIIGTSDYSVLQWWISAAFALSIAFAALLGTPMSKSSKASGA
jgi:hypothetical protein